MFYVQLQEDHTMTETDASILERIKEHNFLHPKYPYNYQLLTLDELRQSTLVPDSVPSGSIDFCETCMQKAYGIDHIPHLLIPPPMSTLAFTGRNIAIAKDKTEMLSLYSKWKATKLFVKSASALKCNYSGIYVEAAARYLPDDTYFVSECLAIHSEWRVFVYRQNIIDLRCYQGDPWIMPNKVIVNQMISAYKGAPNAYTLDVAVAEYPSFPVMRTVIIEVHHFLACGLYGCSSLKLLPMLSSAVQTIVNAVSV